jgi:alkylation response protein AidB-like acyl-CoA dehydrogenase
MDFRLTDDQAALRDGLRELLDGRFGAEQLRAAAEEAGDGRPGGLWRQLAEAGLFSLRRPESQGGLGLGMAAAVLAFEEAGRALLPGPLVATELACAHGVLTGSGSAGLLRIPAGRGPLLVERLPELQLLMLLDRTSNRVRLLDPARLDGRRVRSVDPLTALWQLTGPLPEAEPEPEVEPEPEPEPEAGPAAEAAHLESGAARLWAEGTLLTAALQVGLATRALQSAVGYAAQREQFGQPIGAFQAVQHLCADMLARNEPARVAVRAAAVAFDDGEPWGSVEREIAGAKLLADEAAVRGARDCLQVHGGMGFTWEADVHLMLKRAWVWEHAFAEAVECAELVAAGVSAGGSVGHL